MQVKSKGSVRDHVKDKRPELSSGSWTDGELLRQNKA